MRLVPTVNINKLIKKRNKKQEKISHDITGTKKKTNILYSKRIRIIL